MRAVTATGHLWTQGQKAGIGQSSQASRTFVKMAKSDRDQRLAAKLRENLKRRKMQARARKGAPANAMEDAREPDHPQKTRPRPEADDEG